MARIKQQPRPQDEKKERKKEKRREKQARKAQKPPRVRGAIGRTMIKLPLLRGFYIKRVLALVEDPPKGKPLPPELQQLRNALQRVPPAQRRAFLESALRPAQSGEAQETLQGSRQLRRAAEKQQRKTGGRR